MPENFYYRPPATVTEVLALLVVEANKVNCICKHGVLKCVQDEGKILTGQCFSSRKRDSCRTSNTNTTINNHTLSLAYDVIAKIVVRFNRTITS